ncbi:hypothetical protein FHS07_000316 [Microbacterium proteolyticum]|uniref:Uncharacterized protein n=1 Tax=Microbacterium proteolyticum TaxID=1572644 RepID=A0A7W5CFE7_9MICO|nr:hypothetical protein [Microbacterium proteolyticum]MBB3156632.1 hypothetical protein [Microbacterium proteolyticum]
MNPTLLTAVLADAVTVRDNLLHVLGGGITTLLRPSFPAPLAARLGLTFYFQFPAGHRETVTFGAACKGEDDEVVFEVEGSVDVFSVDSDAPASASIAVPLENAGVPSPGRYVIDVSINGTVQAQIPFRVQLVDPDMMDPASPPFG